MQMLIKCSDVSSPTKEWPIYQQWIERILSEFYNQGDKEKRLGLPISPFMNRDSPGPSLAQKGFIEYIVYPLFEALESWTSIDEIKVNLNWSRDKFCVDSSLTTTSGGASGSKEKLSSRQLRPLNVSFKGEGSFRSGESSSSAALSLKSPVRRSSVVNTIRNHPLFGGSGRQERSNSSLGFHRSNTENLQVKSMTSNVIYEVEDFNENHGAGPSSAATTTSKDPDPFPGEAPKRNANSR